MEAKEGKGNEGGQLSISCTSFLLFSQRVPKEMTHSDRVIHPNTSTQSVNLSRYINTSPNLPGSI